MPDNAVHGFLGHYLSQLHVTINNKEYVNKLSNSKLQTFLAYKIMLNFNEIATLSLE